MLSLLYEVEEHEKLSTSMVSIVLQYCCRSLLSVNNLLGNLETAVKLQLLSSYLNMTSTAISFDHAQFMLLRALHDLCYVHMQLVTHFFSGKQQHGRQRLLKGCNDTTLQHNGMMYKLQ